MILQLNHLQREPATSTTQEVVDTLYARLEEGQHERALPAGKSDANHPAAVADCVADFWTLIRDLDSRKQLLGRDSNEFIPADKFPRH